MMAEGFFGADTEDLQLYMEAADKDWRHLKLIHRLQKRIAGIKIVKGTHLEDYGRLVHDGELKVKVKGDDQFRVRYIFLFDQAMVLCKSKGDGYYNYKNTFLLKNCHVEDSPSSNIKQHKSWTHTFKLLNTTDSSAVTCNAKINDAKEKWIDVIKVALDNVRPAGCKNEHLDFVMYTFRKQTRCAACKKVLVGDFFQGYRCRKTGMAVHKECIQLINSDCTPFAK